MSMSAAKSAATLRKFPVNQTFYNLQLHGRNGQLKLETLTRASAFGSAQPKKLQEFMLTSPRISVARLCSPAASNSTSRPGLVFVSLPVLDIGSQWLQMYSTFLTGKTRHKDAKDSTNWLFKAYYGNRMFMGYCCVACCKGSSLC
ncbi:probable CDP-diacylglycerol--inositol 3-phosphatidyltransferase 2 [Citrus sinensis]|uniref:probable CDP-diacylglycerol--inositol 3-phosphatidyltransferase 2 n=1 Tax=Citrus sinensis TaxID=2711 RepID=UPI00227756EB|nr:probable CDP-diacylglycerol--inositol 3-phosphatidyltransferase 2 [Citrus sinensis]